MDKNSLLTFSTLIISFFLSLLFTGKIKNVLQQHAILDVPNDRSSHSIPIPRGGGLALIAILLPTLIGATFYIDHDLRHMGLIIGVIALAIVSWLDDQSHVSAMGRLSIHIFAVCLGALSFSPHDLLFSGILPFWLDRFIMIVGWAWFINLYNFMDGIDGITGIETISIATGLCLVMAAAGIENPYVEFLTLVLTGISLGFLAHNWYPARIFMGDIGSIPLGYLIGFGLLSLAVKGHLIAALLLPLYYLADSGLTLAKRAMARKKVWQAHREHFYQVSALHLGRHDQVVVFIALANIGLIGAASLSIFDPFFGLFLGIVIVAVLLRKMHKTAS